MVRPLPVLGSATPLATVSLLNGSRPVALAALQHRLDREGRVVIWQGSPRRGSRLVQALAQRQLNASLNLQLLG
ncbi:MAG: hypothetical protein ACK5UG_13485 [Synechococcaceae cyanobacterium]|jgi:hypothetical protein